MLASQTAVSAGAAWLERESNPTRHHLFTGGTPPGGPNRKPRRVFRRLCRAWRDGPRTGTWLSRRPGSLPVRLHQYHYAVPPLLCMGLPVFRSV
jgi:hypothetical protein